MSSIVAFPSLHAHATQTPANETWRAPVPPWQLVEPGRVVEISGEASSGRSTTAALIAAAVQAEGEPVVWLELEGMGVHAPDLARAGIDLDALAFVRLPRREGAHGLCRAAEWLLRSGGFGLVMLDLTGGLPRGPAAPWQSRLGGVARHHGTRLCLLTSSARHAESAGPLISLRLAPTWAGQGFSSETRRVQTAVLKQKGLARAAPAPFEAVVPPGAPAAP